MPSQPPAQRRTRFETAAILAIAIAAQAPTPARPQTLDLPRLRTRSEQTRPVLAAGPGYAPPITTLGAPGAPLPAPSPLPLPLTPPTAPHAALTPRSLDAADLEATALHAAMVREVRNVTMPSRRTAADTAARATAMLRLTHQPITEPQLVIVVDRNPAVERLTLMMARPGAPEGWRAIGSAHVSTGQSGRKDYYITPIGAFAHTAAILDFRALGTYNEHHVRGLGVAGMRVWDFGWQWAIKGWHTDGEGGDIRLQMHATDPDLLERRLGHPASEGCVRLSSTMNRFLDRHGVLDADYERAAIEDVRYSALLPAGATPSPFAGRLLVVIDTNLPAEFPPTAASRPAGLPEPELPSATAPGTDAAADAPVK